MCFSGTSVHNVYAEEEEETESASSEQQTLENSITMSKMKLLKAKLENMNLNKKVQQNRRTRHALNLFLFLLHIFEHNHLILKCMNLLTAKHIWFNCQWSAMEVRTVLQLAWGSAAHPTLCLINRHSNNYKLSRLAHEVNYSHSTMHSCQ